MKLHKLNNVAAGRLAGLVLIGWFLVAAERALASAETALIKHADDIAVESQKITRDYFYVGQNIRADKARADLVETVAAMDASLDGLAKVAKGADQQGILSFLTVIRDDMKATLAKPYSKANGALMLDYSETLLEGAQAIAETTTRADTDDKMLHALEQQDFLLQRINKYYIAFRAGFSDYNTVKELNAAVSAFEKGLVVIEAHKGYPQPLQREVQKLAKYWPIAKGFFLDVEKNTLPRMVFVSADYMEKSLLKLIAHHRGS